MGISWSLHRAEDIFNHPHHPYTISLLSAIPDPEPDKKWHVKLSNGRVGDSDVFPKDANTRIGVPS